MLPWTGTTGACAGGLQVGVLPLVHGTSQCFHCAIQECVRVDAAMVVAACGTAMCIWPCLKRRHTAAFSCFSSV